MPFLAHVTTIDLPTLLAALVAGIAIGVTLAAAVGHHRNR